MTRTGHMPNATPPPEGRRPDNSAQICAAATRLFANRGFDGTSLQAIADQVGVTKQTLLYHYPSKEALRQRVLDNLLGHWAERLPRMLEAVTSGQGRFDALSQELLRFFRDDPDRARLLAREMLDNPAGMRRLIGDKLRPWLMLVGQYIREGQSIGLVHPELDPEVFVLNTVVSAIALVGCESTLAAALASPNKKGPEGRVLSEFLRGSRRALFTERAFRKTPTSPKPDDDTTDAAAGRVATGTE